MELVLNSPVSSCCGNSRANCRCTGNRPTEQALREEMHRMGLPTDLDDGPMPVFGLMDNRLVENAMDDGPMDLPTIDWAELAYKRPAAAGHVDRGSKASQVAQPIANRSDDDDGPMILPTLDYKAMAMEGRSR